jgi:ADP-ribose pyrophosphatase YjhB (NUDIX family)
MEREFRISGGGIVINQGKILLVRYLDSKGKSYLAGSGGGVLVNESTSQAVVREVLEETALIVKPNKILFVEDMLSKRHRIIKIWFLCDLVGGKLTLTHGAKEEKILEVGWYNREQLDNETVYPMPLKKYNWNDFNKGNWQTIYLELREVDF